MTTLSLPSISSRLLVRLFIAAATLAILLNELSLLSGFWPLKNVPSIIPAFAASNGTRHSSNTSSSSIPQQCLPYLHTSPQALASAEDPTPSNTSSAPSTTSSAQSEISSTPSAVEGIVENGTIHVPVGDILGGHRREIHSPNGAYFLRLEDNGNLVLHHNLNLINGTQRLWTLSTGNIEKGFERVARLSNESVLSVFSQEKKKHTEKNGTVRHRVEEQLIWHSNLLDGCARAKVPRGGRAPALTLSSRGELSINGRCSLYTPPPPSAGKMALLVTGLYRTVQKNCENHVKYIVKNPHMEHVDVYAYMLYEPKNLEGNVTVDMLKHKVKECYGSHLADLVIRPVAEVEETYKGEPIELCGKRISRLQSQLKTLYLAGMTWWRISMTKGLRYDTVMRIRPDQQFFGDSMPFFKAANDLSSTELVMPPILAVEGTPRSFHWFCSDPFGDATMAMTDQIAYGSPTAMHFFMTMYSNFQELMSVAIPEQRARSESFLCRARASSPFIQDCPDKSGCITECFTSWYLTSWGLKLHTEWSWYVKLDRIK